jgi:hypothetical protein
LLLLLAAVLPHGMRWIDMADSPMWAPTWADKASLDPDLDFYREGGGVEGCEADPDICAEIRVRRGAPGVEPLTHVDYFHYTVRSMLRHPLAWAGRKWPYLITYGIESPGEGVLLLVLIPMLLLACLQKRDDCGAMVASVLGAGIAGIMVPLLMTHFESRYLYRCKLLIAYLALLMTAAAGEKPSATIPNKPFAS